MKRLTVLVLFLLAALLAGCSGNTSAPQIDDGAKEASTLNTTIDILPNGNLTFPVTVTVEEEDPYDCAIVRTQYLLFNSSHTLIQSWNNYDSPDCEQYFSGSGLSSGWYYLYAYCWGAKNGYYGNDYFLDSDLTYVYKN